MGCYILPKVISFQCQLHIAWYMGVYWCEQGFHYLRVHLSGICFCGAIWAAIMSDGFATCFSPTCLSGRTLFIYQSRLIPEIGLGLDAIPQVLELYSHFSWICDKLRTPFLEYEKSKYYSGCMSLCVLSARNVSIHCPPFYSTHRIDLIVCVPMIVWVTSST